MAKPPSEQPASGPELLRQGLSQAQRLSCQLDLLAVDLRVHAAGPTGNAIDYSDAVLALDEVIQATRRVFQQLAARQDRPVDRQEP